MKNLQGYDLFLIFTPECFQKKLNILSDFQHHRVREPDEEHLRQRTRRSAVYFFNSDEDTIVESLDGSNKYPPISASEYLAQRLQTAKTDSN